METTESIGAWAQETFPGGDPRSPAKALRILDETLELCAATGASVHEIVARTNKIVRKFQEAGTTRFLRDEATVREEAADVKITVLSFEHEQIGDLTPDVDRKMAINRARRWRQNGDGTGQHIKD